MDVPCPKSNSTDPQKVSLACVEVLYRCDKLAHLHGVLVESGGPEVLVGASTTNGTRPMKLIAQSGGVAIRRICRKTSAQLLSFETFAVQTPVAAVPSKKLLAARHQNRAPRGIFRAES
jgi:hypothetical protein